MKKIWMAIAFVLGTALLLPLASCSNGSSDDNNSGNGNGTVVLYSGTSDSETVSTLVYDYELDDYESGYLVLVQEYVSGNANPGYYIDGEWTGSVWTQDSGNTITFKVEDLKGHSLGYNPYGASYKVTVVYSPTLQ